ncbi:MAG: hypothetical protein HOB73_11565 [Planctomycetaceae bacterium]|jgi:hypothetical protein|nr:hypothetical protein [Planctomycetaceae bacterium]
MPFQFRCPQGHLLEGENEDVGQDVNCPICGVRLTIPSAPYTPTASPIEPTVSPYQQQYHQVPSADVTDTAPPVIEPETETFPEEIANASIEEAENTSAIDTDNSQTDSVEQDDNDTLDLESDTAHQDELQIPCPNGHILHATRDMLDEEVICPFCEEQFELKEHHSLEAIEKRQEKHERIFLYWGIGVMVIGIVSVITFMIIFKYN